MTHLTKERLEAAINCMEMAFGFYNTGSRLTIHPTKAKQVLDTLRMARPLIDAKTAPTGWKLVPIEPTEWMFEKFVQIINKTAGQRGGSGNFQDAYAAMLSAAPTPPEKSE